jgi:hypothetical protein
LEFGLELETGLEFLYTLSLSLSLCLSLTPSLSPSLSLSQPKEVLDKKEKNIGSSNVSSNYSTTRGSDEREREIGVNIVSPKPRRG